MTVLPRIAALLARVERRHWLGLGASAALHLAVLLGLRQAPPPEPAPMSFEIAIEVAKPEPALRKKGKIVASKIKPKKRLAKRKPAKREAHTLEAAWRGEKKRRPDTPRVALPDARALGVSAPLEQAARPGSRPLLATANKAAVTAKPQDAPGLSEPGLPGASPALLPAPGAETGIALTPASTLAMNPAPGAGAQGVDAATSLAASPQQAERAMSASAGQGAGVSAGADSGAQTHSASAAPPQAGGEPQGIRLAASGSLSLRPELPAGAGSLDAAPPSVDAGPAAPTQGSGGGTILSSAGGTPAPASPARQGGGADGAAGGTPSAPAAGQGAAARETPGRLAGAGKLDTTLPGSRNRAARAGAPVQAGKSMVQADKATPQAGKTLALAPGEPGSAPNLAVAMGTVTAAPPQAGKDRTGKSAGGMPGADAAEPLGAAARAGGTGARGRPGPAASVAIAAPQAGGQGGGMAMAAPSLPGAGAPAVLAPVKLQTVDPAAVKVLRPDSAEKPLDVLAPSSYCPLPGHSLPDNRPKPAADSAEKPGYAHNNPNFIYPIQAWAYNVEGHVTVRVEVRADGTPGKMWLKQSSGNGILDRDAQYQLSRWRFTPARKNGQPVTAWIDIPVVYRLQGAKP